MLWVLIRSSLSRAYVFTEKDEKYWNFLFEIFFFLFWFYGPFKNISLISS